MISWKFQKLSSAMRSRLAFGGNNMPSGRLTDVYGSSTCRQKSTDNTRSSSEA
jgi:hypothetical protein